MNATKPIRNSLHRRWASHQLFRLLFSFMPCLAPAPVFVPLPIIGWEKQLVLLIHDGKERQALQVIPQWLITSNPFLPLESIHSISFNSETFVLILSNILHSTSFLGSDFQNLDCSWDNFVHFTNLFLPFSFLKRPSFWQKFWTSPLAENCKDQN